MEQIDLEAYLSNGVDNIVKGILKTSLKNPQASIFMLQYANESKKARKLRQQAEHDGEHIPPFLIASISNKCNLHCKGCYARANHSCMDGSSDDSRFGLLTADQWKRIFSEAADLGVGFILLAGGEPFVRRDVLAAAGKQRNILFPIFTNGTMIDADDMELLAKNRNLVPIISLEGNQETTDGRRGQGIYDKLKRTMNDLQSRGILFGTSVTVHKNNLEEVLSDCFIDDLKKSGCKAVIYVEYVPMDQAGRELALDDGARNIMMQKLNEIRWKDRVCPSAGFAHGNEITGSKEDNKEILGKSLKQDMLFISFPGDEKSSGGCLAAGRGFFHINAYGGAEPCPFSPYSDVSLKDTSLRGVLRSPLFLKLQSSGNLIKEHMGGCVLFEQETQVKEMLEGIKE
jgi:MoaA/NifB/PqqE/SkfB family radical SAM enzyme